MVLGPTTTSKAAAVYAYPRTSLQICDITHSLSMRPPPAQANDAYGAPHDTLRAPFARASEERSWQRLALSGCTLNLLPAAREPTPTLARKSGQ